MILNKFYCDLLDELDLYTIEEDYPYITLKDMKNINENILLEEISDNELFIWNLGLPNIDYVKLFHILLSTRSNIYIDLEVYNQTKKKINYKVFNVDIQSDTKCVEITKAPLNFSRLTLDEMGLLSKYFNKFNTVLCDYTLGGTLMWREYFKKEYVVFNNDTLLIKLQYIDGNTVFMWPLGNIELGLEKIREFCYTHNIPMILCAVDCDNETSFFRLCPKYFYNAISFHGLIGWSDFIYNKEDLEYLEGKKFHKIKNRVNKFKQEYPDYYTKTIDETNIDEIIRFTTNNLDTKHSSDTAKEEYEKTLELLDNYILYSKYDVFGLALYIDNRIIGYAIGEENKISQTLFMHIEKCNNKIKGAHQVLTNEFIKTFGKDCCYVNREEDVDDEGLRRSKISYNPSMNKLKFNITMKV